VKKLRAAVVVSLALVVGGCSEDEPKPSTLPPAPTASASAAQLEPAPQEAAADTPAGAAAFADFFFEELNRAYAERRPEIVTGLATDACKSCAATAADIQRLRDADHTVAGRRYILSSSEAPPADPDGKTLVDFRFTTDPYVEVDSSGKVAQEFPEEPTQDGQILLTRVAGAWRADGIRLLDQ